MKIPAAKRERDLITELLETTSYYPEPEPEPTEGDFSRVYDFAFDESEHPRWPRNSGRKSGQFRDKVGGDGREFLMDFQVSSAMETKIRKVRRDATQHLYKQAETAESLLDEKMGPYQKTSWKKTVKINGKLKAYGMKAWDCHIEIAPHTLMDNNPVTQAHTILHEEIHGYSNLRSGDKYDYAFMTGWEEGPVEALTRHWLPEMGTRSSLSPEDVEKKLDDLMTHPYSRYVRPLEALRNDVGMDPEPFYRGLLAKRVADRPDYMMETYPEVATRERIDEINRHLNLQFSGM